jgi:transposase InsO family protein
VKLACDLLEVSRSAYYQWQQRSQAPSTREQEDTRLSKQIVAIHGENRGAYGAPRVHHQLRQDGERCSRKRVARLMSQLKLVGRAPRRFKRTTQSDPRAAAEDLVGRRFAPELYEPNQVWVGDISYVRTWEGWLYLATVIDLGSRRVVGLAMADHMRAELVIEAMRMAITSRRPGSGVIFHSDRGSQYTSGAFRTLLAKHGIVQSMSRVGECWDNAVAESFFATLKNELAYREVWPTRAGARRGIFEYIEAFYNRRRLHSSLGYRSPVDYEAWRAAISSAVHAA